MVEGELEDNQETLGFVVRAENARMTQVAPRPLQTGSLLKVLHRFGTSTSALGLSTGFKALTDVVWACKGGRSRIKLWELEPLGFEFQHLETMKQTLNLQ